MHELVRCLNEPHRFLQVVAGARQVSKTTLVAQADISFAEAYADHSFWGRLVELAVGAHLANAAVSHLYYWCKGNHEVDFVVCTGRH